MGKEIEKKFLISEGGHNYSSVALRRLYPSVSGLIEDVLSRGKEIIQGYLPVDAGLDVARHVGLDVDFYPTEARLRGKGGKFILTLKREGGGFARDEDEATLPKGLFDFYWPRTRGRRVRKSRLEVPWGDLSLLDALGMHYKHLSAEIDVYTDGRDLVTGEVEVSRRLRLLFVPSLGEDVSKVMAYRNANLAR